MFSRSPLIPFCTFSVVPLCTGIRIQILVGIMKLSRCAPVLVSMSRMPFLPTVLPLVSLIHCAVASLVAGIALLFFDIAGISPVAVAS